ncbi:hypothetical protein [Kribbella sp. NPDC049227]|uniref:hypothetical protein n=1 Tax=Kribbella sp. NPDC049227 TaxID=3364113 RepID=UPI0037144BE4
MSALPGGDADKWGNRYEGLWTLLRLCDVIEGRASSIRIEPPGPEGDGVEFVVHELNGVTTGDQVKSTPQPWSVHRLVSNGVLSSIAQRLATGGHVNLVVESGARELDSLTRRARKAKSATEFVDTVITDKEQGHLAAIATHWGVDNDLAWEMLARINVRHQPASGLETSLGVRVDALIGGDPADAIDWLRGWIDHQTQQTLTGPIIRQALEGAGFHLSLLRDDKGALLELEQTVERAERRVAHARPRVQVETPHATRLRELLSVTEGPRVIVVHGRAGSGKSKTAFEAVEQLHKDRWYAAVVRMDGKEVEELTAAGLGKASGLSRSPATLLGGMVTGDDPDLRAVLLIDQLDAVSEYSGRMPSAFEAVEEVLHQAREFPALRVILVVRTVDLQQDGRIGQLLSDEARVTALELTLLEPDELRQALNQANINTSTMPDVTLQLLRVPLHLAVFLKLSTAAQAEAYATLPALYDRYTKDVRTTLDRDRPTLDWARLTSTLVQAMSDAQRLRVPEAVVDDLPPTDISTLVSLGILETDGSEVWFFHETYFDYLFARNFAKSGRDLHSFLVGEGQALFRRAQTRQVLDYLTSTPGKFRATVVELLTSQQIRPHIKEVVAGVLRQHKPTPADWDALEPVAFGADSGAAARAISLLSFPGWFDAADSAGRIEAFLADPGKVDAVVRQMTFLRDEFGARLSELLLPYVGTTPEWRERFRMVAQWAMNSQMVDLMVALLSAGELDDLPGAIASNADLFTDLYGLHHDNPAGAARVIAAAVNRAVSRAAGIGETDPFEAGFLPDHSPGGDRVIVEVALAAPETYLNELLTTVTGMIEAEAVEPANGALRWSVKWGRSSPGGRDGLPGALYGGLDAALRKVAATDPAAAISAVAPLAESDVEELRWLACRTYQCLDSHEVGLSFLLADQRNLSLGYRDNRRWTSRELVERVAASCSDEQLADLVDALTNYTAWWAQDPDGEEWRERGSYELLTAIPADRRQRDVAQRIASLEAKYSDLEVEPPKPLTMAPMIGSPIPEEDSKNLTDEEWLRAIGDYPELLSTNMRGGASQLAAQIGRRASEQPVRFAELALKLDQSAPVVHLQRIISAIAGSVDLGLLSQVCLHAHDIAGAEVLRVIYDAIQNVAAADDRLLTLLEKGAEYEVGRHDPYESGNDILTAGINSIPGAAARAIATLWFAGDEHGERLTPTLEKLATADSVATRAMASEAAAALLNHNRAKALDIADALLQGPIDDMIRAVTVRDLLIYSFIRDPERFAPHLLRALNGSADGARQAGQIWAMALVQDRLGDSLPATVSSLSAAARRGAAEALASHPLSALDSLTALLSEANPEIRAAAAPAVGALATAEDGLAEELLARFLASAAFADHHEEAIRALAKRTQVLPPSTLLACERVVQAAGPDIGNIATAPARMAQDLSRLVLRLYRQSDAAEERERCLDLIDQLTEWRAYGLAELIDDQR